jgi:hypothetical protein
MLLKTSSEAISLHKIWLNFDATKKLYVGAANKFLFDLHMPLPKIGAQKYRYSYNKHKQEF